MSERQRFVCAALMAVAAILPADAPAQSPAQGRVLRDRTVIWDADSPIAVATVMAGAVLQVTAQSERWYEVVVPEALGGAGRRGLIARPQLQLLEGSPSPPLRALRGDPLPSRPAGQVQPPPAPRGPAFARGFVALNGIMQTTSNDFADTVEFREHAEDSRFETAYVVDGAPGFSVTAGSMLSPVLGIGGSLGRIARSTPATFAAAVPHPFFFGTPRGISADISQMRREELGVHAHVRALWPVTERVQISALGGPSLFRVSQDVVSTFSFTESYPYDTAVFRSSESVNAAATTLGFNVGGDVTVFLTPHVGVGVSATFSRATLDLDVSEGRTARVRAGGLNTGGGLRLRF